MFSISQRTPVFPTRDRALTLETWRETADVVAIRWHVFLEADAASRPRAFASYVAALDAEEAAAAELALVSDVAA
jgi:hypothetical protein